MVYGRCASNGQKSHENSKISLDSSPSSRALWDMGSYIVREQASTGREPAHAKASRAFRPAAILTGKREVRELRNSLNLLDLQA